MGKLLFFFFCFFRLMRMVQSLLLMREPNLANLNREDTLSVLESQRGDETLSLQTNSCFANSTALILAPSESSFLNGASAGAASRASFKSSSSSSEVDNNFEAGTRTSLDSGSSKTTEDDRQSTKNDFAANNNSQMVNGGPLALALVVNSTPLRRINRIKREEMAFKSKHETNSSAEDESGFSSMSSFQEVGLPSVIPKGCHTEVGLPEVPIEKIKHRRWSSNPVEIQALIKRHSVNLTGQEASAESLSVWV